MVNIRLPKVDATTVPGQVDQIRSYLFQLVEELQVSLDQMETALRECQEENGALKEQLKQAGLS